MTTLVAFFLRLLVLAAFVFGFVVLFEHGSANYGENAKKEWETFVAFVQEKASASPQPAATPAPVATPTPAPTPVAEVPPAVVPDSTPVPAKPPTAWEALQNRKIGEGIDEPIGATPAP